MRELLSYFFSQPDSHELKLLLVVEEAHKFIPKNTPGIPNELYIFLDRVIRELRRKGVGTIFISHVMTDFRQSIRANTATTIRLRTKYDGDIIRANKDIGSPFANFIPKLNTGQGIVSFPDFGNPFIVQFRPPLHNPFVLSDKEIQKEMRFFKEKKHVPELLENKLDDIKKLSDKDLRAIKNISPKIYDVIRFLRTTRGLNYAKDMSSMEFNEIKEKINNIPEKKFHILKEVLPEFYDIINNLKEIFKIEEDLEPPEEEIFVQKIRKFSVEKGIPPKQSDIIKDLGWGWKKTSEIVSKLENQGRIKLKPDLKDKRIKRIILNE
jgi:DNA-binding MarR family transcriptional regulator